MLRSLNSAVSGMQQSQMGLDVIGNNIANANTTGFKAGRITFEDSFSQNLQVASAAGGVSTSSQIGSGVAPSSISNVFTQGPVTSTGVTTDVAINGEGFFVVRDPVSNEMFVTRAGNFSKDTSGYLVTSDGMRLQGYNDSAKTTRGDILIDAAGAPATAAAGATVASTTIDANGDVSCMLNDGTTFVRGQVLLQAFSNPQALLKAGDNLYSRIDLAGPVGGSLMPMPPGQSGTGKLKSGALELSNVDLTREFANMITTQRAFQANARVVTTSDEVLQELVNLKR